MLPALRVRPLLVMIAPPSSVATRLLRSAYRTFKSLPELLQPRILSLAMASIVDMMSSQLAIVFCRDPIAKDRLRAAARTAPRRIFHLVAFPFVDRPNVSIIVVVRNRVWNTMECLGALRAQARESDSYEVIAVDDGSSNRSFRILSRVPGLVVLRSDRALGSMASYNCGAAAARGEYLVCLDEDARMTPGCLDALAQTFRDFPRAGLAGAKLVLPDARLLEAGASVWRDGRGDSYGRSGDAGHPSYNFAREVDWCSAGCLMITRAMFCGLGGFDPTYESRAAATIDLAMRIRQSGRRVIYQPLASVVQHERPGKLAPETSEPEKLCAARLRERWHEAIASHPEAPSGPIRLVSAAGLAIGQVLVIDHRLPTADRDSGSFRMIELIRAIKRRGHHVAFIPDNWGVFSPYLEDLERIGVEVVCPPFYNSPHDFLKQHGRQFRLAIISRADVAARNMAAVRQLAPQARIVFDTVDLCFLREERQARIGGDPDLHAVASSRKEQELRLARQADVTLVVSPIEKAVLEAECGPEVDVRILSNIHPAVEGQRPDHDERQTIVFIGGFEHAPNVDAVLFFAQEIFPRIQELIPEAVFQVVGPSPTPEICALASPSIHILGFVADVRPIFDNARVSVAPLRFGAGVKGKVNQSMSFGVPTIVTSIAAEGMYLTDELDAMIADVPERFADAVVRLWTSSELWRHGFAERPAQPSGTFLGRGCREAHRRAFDLGRPGGNGQ